MPIKKKQIIHSKEHNKTFQIKDIIMNKKIKNRRDTEIKFPF